MSPPRWTPRLLIAGSLLVLAAALAAHWSGRWVWDDGYMFVRYANNLLTHGSISWNPGGSASYGLTSLLSLLTAVPATLIGAGSPGFAAFLGSAMAGVLFMVTFLLLLLRAEPPSPSAGRLPAALVVLQLAISSEMVAIHMSSGMDTCFAMGFLSLYILMALWFERDPSPSAASAMGILGGLAWWGRPDLMVFTLLVPGGFILFSSGRPRRMAALALSLTAGTSALLAGLGWIYFGSAVPLPFHAKATGMYGDEIRGIYASGWKTQWREMAFAYPILFAAVALTALGRVVMRKALTALEISLAVGCIAFALYYAWKVLPIMGASARFYQPLVPVLGFLALRGLSRAVTAGSRTVTASVLVMALLLAAAAVDATFGLLEARRSPEYASFELSRIYRDGYQQSQANVWSSYWPGLPDFSRLPDDLVIATTEVGLPGAMNPRKQIIDLAGLNTPDFTTAPFNSTALFVRYRPDLLYLPHPNYASMLTAVRTHEIFERDYDLVLPPSPPKVWLGVALLRESPHYLEMRAIAAGLDGFTE